MKKTILGPIIILLVSLQVNYCGLIADTENILDESSHLLYKRELHVSCPCKSGQCLSFSVCNGFEDCDNGEDEKPELCRNNTKCLPGYFQCKSGQCLVHYWVCNGYFNCHDRDDEKPEVCRNYRKCSDKEFQCASGACLNPVYGLCDGKEDCIDGDDESPENCMDNKCPADKFRCKSGQCLSTDWVCDGIYHCYDQDDEKPDVCRNNTKCPADKFRCKSGQCLRNDLVCNGISNCYNGDDELPEVCRNNSKCSADKFQCKSGQCLHNDLVCNGVNNCYDRDDEKPEVCLNNTKCSDDKFRCTSGACLNRIWLCDGSEDCYDGDDESPENCRNNKNRRQNNKSCFLPSESAHQTFSVHCPNTADCSRNAGEKVPVFTQIRVDCSEGYQLSDKNTTISSCFQGKWGPPIPKCFRTCEPIRNPDLDLICLQKLRGFQIPCDDFMPEGAIIYPKCKSYFHQDREIQYSFIRCQSNGQWDQPLFKCIADCGKARGNTQGLIVSGKPEQRGDSPWHVAIYDISDPKEPILICGGTIITLQIIVTAAHCFYNFADGNFYNSSLYEVVVAKYTRDYKVKDNTETKVYKIQKIFTPEIIIFNGEATNYVGDIALIWTSEKIAFSSGVLPACIEWTQTTRFIVPDGTEGKLVGWGLTETQEPSPVLLAASLPYVNYKNCQMIKEEFRPGADKFCAGFKKGAGARQGDSGGGLLFRKVNANGNLYYLRGIVSNRDGTIGENETSVAAFTDIAQYVSWMYDKKIEIENEELLAETKIGLKT